MINQILFNKTVKINIFINVHLPDPTTRDFSKTLSWGRLYTYNRKRTSKPSLLKLCIWSKDIFKNSQKF